VNAKPVSNSRMAVDHAEDDGNLRIEILDLRYSRAIRP
jgi:hypothetical protein